MLRRLLFALAGLLLLFSVALNCRADEVTPKMRQADARLETRVTLRSPHILIGELLERLSEQSTVPLLADDWSTAGSDSVTVSLRNVPLADAMNALWSLFSYQHAEWDWRRRPVKGQTGQYTYTLARPDEARFLAEHLQEQVQADFEAQAQELFDALNMPPDQLKEAAKHDDLLDSLLKDGRVRPGIEILASLPPDTLQNILYNHQGLSMPISELPLQAQQAITTARNWEIAEVAKKGYPASALGKTSDHISIYTFQDGVFVAPGLNIDTGWGSGDYFGGGFMQDAWQKKMNAQWMQPGDNADDPASAHALVPSKKPASAEDFQHPLADSLLRLSKAAQIPLMARIPQALDKGTNLSILSQVPMTKSVTAFLDQAKQTPLGMDYKWRGGVLLMTCQNWFVGQSESARLPWAEVKRLRDIEASGDGFLTLNDMAHAASVLNDAQMSALGEWFPVMTNAEQWHDLLAFYDKTPEYHPKALSSKGDDWQLPESLVNAQLGIDALRVTHPNLRLQIQQKQNTVNKPPVHEILFVVRDDDGVHPINGRGFGWEAHEYQHSLQVSEKADAGITALGAKGGSAAK